MTQEIDKETSQLLNRHKKLSEFVNGEDWADIKDRFSRKIMDLQSIKNLAHAKDSNEVMNEIKVRNGVVDVLLEIIHEIEGEAAQFDNHRTARTEVIEGFIVSLGGEEV